MTDQCWEFLLCGPLPVTGEGSVHGRRSVILWRFLSHGIKSARERHPSGPANVLTVSQLVLALYIGRIFVMTNIKRAVYYPGKVCGSHVYGKWASGVTSCMHHLASARRSGWSPRWINWTRTYMAFSILNEVVDIGKNKLDINWNVVRLTLLLQGPCIQVL